MANLMDDLKKTASNLVQKCRKGVDVVALKLDEGGQTRKLGAGIRKLNRERAELLGDIGKKVYTLHLRGKVSNKDVLGNCERIDAIAAETTEIQDKIEEIRRSGAVDITVEIEDDAELGPEDDADDEAEGEDEADDEADDEAS